MSLRVGASVKDATTGVEIIIVKAPSDDGNFCVVATDGEGLLLGKRYHCTHCAAEALVSRSGAAQLICHGTALALSPAKALPSSD
jgi:hypothetical protein